METTNPRRALRLSRLLLGSNPFSGFSHQASSETSGWSTTTPWPGSRKASLFEA